MCLQDQGKSCARDLTAQILTQSIGQECGSPTGLSQNLVGEGK